MNFIRKNAPPATASALEARAAELRDTVESDTRKREQLESDMPHAVADAVAYGSLRDEIDRLDASLRSDSKALVLIEAQIPVAQQRERRERVIAEVDEAARRSAKLQRGLEARYSKAAEAFAEVCRDIQADADKLRSLRALADTVSPRVPVRHRSAEMALRFDKFANSHNGLKGLTEGLTVRAWNGESLFG